MADGLLLLSLSRARKRLPPAVPDPSFDQVDDTGLLCRMLRQLRRYWMRIKTIIRMCASLHHGEINDDMMCLSSNLSVD